MVKAHKRKNSGSMRRASRVYLTNVNVGKVMALRAFLSLYINVVNYFIERFWSMKDFTAALADKVVTSRAVNRFMITARLAQCAAKQAKEIVRSQKERRVVSCGHEDDADRNAAKNLEYLGLAGVYSLHLLPS